MAMTSLIEMYLTAYGWKLYALIYGVLKITLLIIIPFLRFFIVAMIESFEAQKGDQTPIRKTWTGFIIMFVIYMITIPPFGTLNISTTTIQSPGCGKVTVPKKQRDDLADRFGAGVQVPLIPYLMMSVSSGVTSAILSNMPCAVDILEANRVSNGFSLSPYGDIENLRSEMQDFGLNCYMPAKELASTWNNSPDPRRKEVFRQLGRKYYTQGYGIFSTQNSQYRDNTDYVGSEFMEKVFYTYDANVNFIPCEGKLAKYCNNSTLSSAELSKTWEDMRTALPLTIMTPYTTQVNAKCNLSKYQQQSKIGCISCGQYWKGSSFSGNNYDGIVHRIAINFFLGEIPKAVSGALSGKSPKVAYYDQLIDPDAFDADPEGYADRVVRSLSQEKVRDIAAQVYENVLANPNAESILGGKGIMVATGYAAVTIAENWKDPIGGIAKEAKKFGGMLVSLMLVKEGLRIFFPMIIMLIYAFWGIFMIIGGYSPKVLWQGILMIFLMKLVPLGWAIADIVGSQLMTLLYPDVSGLDWVFKQIDRVIVMVAMVFFYLAVPSILMYIFAVAGSNLSAFTGESLRASEKTGGKFAK